MAPPRPLVMQLLLAFVCCALATSAGMLGRDVSSMVMKVSGAFELVNELSSKVHGIVLAMQSAALMSMACKFCCDVVRVEEHSNTYLQTAAPCEQDRQHSVLQSRRP